MRKCSFYAITSLLITALLMNGIGLSIVFKAEFFAHALDHMHQTMPSNRDAHLEAHHNGFFKNNSEQDATTHLCLHTASQYQPFYMIRLSIAPPQFESTATLSTYIPLIVLDSILESPYHPPRITWRQLV